MTKCERCNKVTNDIHTCTPSANHLRLLLFVRELARIHVTVEENFPLHSWVEEARMTLDFINENYQGA